MTGCRNHVFHAPAAADGRGFLVARRKLSCRHSWTGVERHCRTATDFDGSPAPRPWRHLMREVGHLAASALIVSGLGASLVLAPLPPGLEAQAVTTEQLLFLEAWRAVDRAYVDKSFNGQSWFRLREKYLKSEPMDTREQTYAAIRKALATLDDPFTRFLEPARYAALRRGTAGAAVVGVGLEVGFGDKGKLVIITPAPGGPAERAGVQPADMLESIDGRSVTGVSLYEVGDLLQGAEGSEVVLRVQSHKGGVSRDVALRRERISSNPVSSQLCRNPNAGFDGLASNSGGELLGYIRVRTFSKTTSERVQKAIQSLHDDGARRFVLDIRNNGGGLFPAGVEVARMWVPTGDLVLIADATGVRDTYEASGNALDASSPLVVLVNRGTASASEWCKLCNPVEVLRVTRCLPPPRLKMPWVLAGALQDNHRARIIGERTFGKGLIQTIVELSDGSGIAVTVARYQTPSGTDINKVGIAPDVLLAPEDFPPQDGPAFCQYMASARAPPLFG